MSPRSQRGMTLIELMTVLVVLAILTSIAIPSYRGYVLRASRADAKAGLLSTASALERCFSQFNSYTNAGCTVVLPVASGEGKYQISGSFPTATQFVLTAAPQGKQADDKSCGSFTLTERNVKGISGGTKTAKECWGK